jgi:hypothetical protein
MSCDRATEQMALYKPAEHEETINVAPLLQFFELVHIGDTIQSMVQVYFDRELVGNTFITQQLACLLWYVAWNRRPITLIGRTF